MKPADARPADVLRKLWSRYRTWIIFLACFMALQAVNVWDSMPDYADSHVFGFPLFYVHWQDGAGYTYFNALVLFIDMLIVYVAVRAVMYAYSQINKFTVPGKE